MIKSLLILAVSFTGALAQNCEDFTDFYCVHVKQCIEGVIDRSGSNFITIRNSGSFISEQPDSETKRLALSSACEKITDTCCYLESSQPARQQAIGRVAAPKPTCGVHNRGGVEGLTGPGDKTADFGEYPHVCAILSSQIIGGRRVKEYEGGASLLTTRAVLTGAKVINEFAVDELQVRCGEWNKLDRVEPLTHQSRSVDKVIIHPEFNQDNLYNNFGLLFVSEDFKLDKHLSPVCLPDPLSFDERYTDCVGTGWGKEDLDGEYPDLLKEVRQSLVDRDTCQNRLTQTALGRFFLLHESFICAGGVPSEDLCQGDGGSPLTCTGLDGSLYQLGLSSWGLGCNQAIPAVYTSMEYGACWIDEQVTCDQFDRSSGAAPESVFGFSSSCGQISCR